MNLQQNKSAIFITKMFDSEYDVQTPTTFPKTDINFYMNSSNFSAIQPWNRTTYKWKPEKNNIIQLSNIAKRKQSKQRSFSFEYYEKAVQAQKRRSVSGVKHQITLSTLTFNLSAQSSVDKKVKKRNTFYNSSMIKVKKETGNRQNSVEKQPEITPFFAENPINRGFTNTLRHNTLLKLKHQHQSKIKDLITKKQLLNRGNVVKFSILQKSCDLEKQKLTDSGFSQIVKQNEKQEKAVSELMKKPRKSSYIGIRKFVVQSN